MAMADTQDRPGTTERYLSATETSDLTLIDHRTGAADLLIAAGLSEDKVGASLARLVSEWDSAAKPRVATPAIIKEVAARMREWDAKDKESAQARGKPYTPPGSVEGRARAEASAWYTRELRLFAQGLRSRGECVEHVRQWCAVKGLDQDYAGAALYHWLNPTCPICQGRGMTKPPDAPSLTKACNACSATGKTVLTAQAFRIGEWLTGCLGRANRSIGGNREVVKAAKRWIAEKRG